MIYTYKVYIQTCLWFAQKGVFIELTSLTNVNSIKRMVSCVSAIPLVYFAVSILHFRFNCAFLRHTAHPFNNKISIKFIIRGFICW